jgi:transposase-like protein
MFLSENYRDPYLANQNITRRWTRPIRNWPQILNQLVIRFENRLPL